MWMKQSIEEKPVALMCMPCFKYNIGSQQQQHFTHLTAAKWLGIQRPTMFHMHPVLMTCLYVIEHM